MGAVDGKLLSVGHYGVDPDAGPCWRATSHGRAWPGRALTVVWPGVPVISYGEEDRASVICWNWARAHAGGAGRCHWQTPGAGFTDERGMLARATADGLPVTAR